MPEDGEDPRDRENRVALVAAGLLVAISVIVMLLFHRSQNELDCVLAGHRNCAPINFSR